MIVVCALTVAWTATVCAQDQTDRPDRTRPVKPTLRNTSPVAEMPDSLIDLDSLFGPDSLELPAYLEGDSLVTIHPDSVVVALPETDEMPSLAVQDSNVGQWQEYTFNPDPNRAVWLSALFPGLGQLYNRRYWKLPLVIGGFMGLGYATSWNNGMLRDYTRAYLDIMDSDPSTRSYMDFFPSTTQESSLNKTWLTNVLKSRKDYYRRNRDLCIIAMVGVYLVAMVDAYVDAQLAHFDISPNLSVDWAPAVIQDTRSTLPSIGMQWAFNF